MIVKGCGKQSKALFTHWVLSDSFWPQDCSTPGSAVLHHLRACSNSCPLSRWCHPAISSSVIPSSSCFQSFPASGSFPMSRLFASGGQSVGASVSVSQSVGSVTQSYLTLCNPMDCSTPGLPVHLQLPEPTQTHVCWVGDAIQPSYPLSSPPPPAFNLPQHQGLFQWVSSLHQVVKVLQFQLRHQSFQSIFRTDFL